jgi:hypothetical protein
MEPIAGVFAHSPFLAIFAALPWIRPHEPRARIVLLISLLLGSGLLVLFSVFGTTMRYEVDFISFFLVPALLLWFKILQEAGTRSAPGLRVLGGAFVVLLGIGVLSNLFISFTGYYDNLKTAKPHTYEAVHELFRPIERLFAPSLELVEVIAPNGLEQVNGQSFFWLGGPPASVVIRSDTRRDVELGMTFVGGPSVEPGLGTRRVRVRVPKTGWTRELVVYGGPERVRVPVERGSTVIGLEALDPQVVPIQPNGDTRPLIVGVQGLGVAAAR